MYRRRFAVEGKVAVICGGSKGLGKEIANQLAAKGADIVLLARTASDLSIAKQEVESKRRRPEQSVTTISIDLTNAEEVEKVFTQLPVIPDILFCVAGGATNELGFFADLETSQIKGCFEKNYYTTAFPTHALLRRWLKEPSIDRTTRHLIFTASTAAFVGLPGYVAYTPTKAAVRALADTLRQELLLYGGDDVFQVHCSFPGTIFTDAFLEEQVTKPELTKKLEGSDDPQKVDGLTAVEVAKRTLKGVENGEFLITMDTTGGLLLNNMRGPSPRNSYLWDAILGVVGCLAWPFYRVMFDRETSKYLRKSL